MKRAVILTSIAVAGLVAAGVTAQQRAPVSLGEVGKVEKIADNLYKVNGQGGNTTIFVMENGVALVDTKMPNNGPTILERVRSITDKPVTMLINTHVHPDHNGSNDFFKAQRPTIDIFQHENSAANVAANPRAVDGMKGNKTFKDKMSIGTGKDQIDLYYFGPAHTGGDAIVVFKAARTLAIGDIMAWSMAPLIDPASGGSVVKLPDTVEKIVDFVPNVDKVIQGHGDVISWNMLRSYMTFSRALLEGAKQGLARNQTPEQVLAGLMTHPSMLYFMKDSLLPGLEYGGTGRSRALININVAYQELKGERVTTNFGPPPPAPAGGAAPQPPRN
jgi:glyoxylase-like metal-dependent hydrolase (beta-lactamase superfamily II)